MQFFVFFFNDTATTEIYTLSLHDALPICDSASRRLPPKEKGFLHMLGIPAPGPDSRCLLSAVIQQQAHLLGPKTRSAADRKSTRLNSSHGYISYAVFCLKKKKNPTCTTTHDGKIRSIPMLAPDYADTHSRKPTPSSYIKKLADV